MSKGKKKLKKLLKKKLKKNILVPFRSDHVNKTNVHVKQVIKENIKICSVPFLSGGNLSGVGNVSTLIFALLVVKIELF